MKGQRIRPAAPLAATCARLMYLTLTLALLARLPLAINASPTVAAYTVGPNNADFPTLPAAWAVLVAQQTDAILRLANGVHPIPPDSVTLLDASSATRPFTISHVPVAPAVGGGGVGGVLISPGQPTQPQEYLGASSLVTLSGPVVLAFSNITFAGFACVDRTFNSPWAVVALYGTSQLVLTDVTIRDNGAINAVFALAAQDSAFVTLERVAMVADSAHSIEFLSMGSAAISVFDSRIEGVSAWRDTVFDAYNAAAVTVVRTVFTRNQNQVMALRDTATGTIASSQFTYNTSPTISGYATALLVSGGSATISQSEFTGNSGGQTGAIAFVNGRGNITDTVIRGNSGSVIMAVRAAGTSAVSMRACSISGHNGAPRLVQISEAAQVVMDGMDIYGNTQGWLLGLYTSSSLLLSNTLIYDNSFAGTSAFYIGQGLLATFRNVTFANNNATTYLIVGDRSSDLRMASTVFTGNTIQSGGLLQSYGQNLAVSDCTLSSNTVTSQTSNDRLILATGTIANASFVIQRSSFTKNSASTILAFGNVNRATNRIDQCSFTANSGPIAVLDSTPLEITGSEFVGNAGPAVYVQGGSARIDQSRFAETMGGTYGGVIWFTPSTTAATAPGTAASSGNSGLVVTASKFQHNAARFDGGAIYLAGTSDPSTISITGNTFTANTAARGGAIYAYSASSVSPAQAAAIQAQNAFEGNRASAGQGNDVATQPANLAHMVLGSSPTNGQQQQQQQSVTIYSGDALPGFQVVSQDAFGQTAQTTSDETFLLQYQVISSSSTSPLSAPAPVFIGEIAKAILDGPAVFQGIKFVAAPGTYTLAVASMNDIYPLGRFNVSTVVTVAECTAPRVLAPYSPSNAASFSSSSVIPSSGLSVCAVPICNQGCVQGQGTCVAANVCRCEPAFEGTDCSLKVGFNDAISVAFAVDQTESALEDVTAAPVALAVDIEPSPVTFADPVSAQLVPESASFARLSKRSIAAAPDILGQSLLSSFGQQVVQALTGRITAGTPVLRNVAMSDDGQQLVANLSVIGTEDHVFLEQAALHAALAQVQAALVETPRIVAAASAPDSADPTKPPRMAEIVAQFSPGKTAMVDSPKLVVEYTSPLGIVVLAVTATCLLLTLTVMAVLIRYKATPVIRSSSFFFGMLICGGLMLGYLVIPLSLGFPSRFTCAAQAWAISLSVGLVLGSLVTKTMRIMLIFGGGRKGRLVGLADRDMLKYLVGVLVGEVVLAGLWTGLDPPGPIIVDTATYRYWTCGSMRTSISTTTGTGTGGSSQPAYLGLMLAYDVSLLLFSVYLAIRTRSAQSAYRESKSIGIAVYLMTVVCGLIIPILLLPSTGPLVALALKATALIVVNLTITYLMFFVKVYVAVLRPDLNNMDALNQRGSGLLRRSRNASGSRNGRGGAGSEAITSRLVSAVGMRLSRQGESVNDGIGSRRGTTAASAQRPSTAATGASSVLKTARLGATIINRATGVAGVQGNSPASVSSSSLALSIRAMMAAATGRARHNSPSQDSAPALTQGEPIASAAVTSDENNEDDGLGSAMTMADKKVTPAAAVNARKARVVAISGVHEADEDDTDTHPNHRRASTAANSKPQLPKTAQLELFYVRPPSLWRSTFQQRYLHFYPATRHLVISASPMPVEATVLQLDACDVRNMSHVIRNCMEISDGNHTWWIRTRQDAVFSRWIGWIALVIQQQQEQQQEEQEDGDEANIGDSNAETIAGSNLVLDAKKDLA